MSTLGNRKGRTHFKHVNKRHFQESLCTVLESQDDRKVVWHMIFATTPKQKKTQFWTISAGQILALTHSTLRPCIARAGLSAVPSCLCAIHVRDTCSLDTDLRSIKGMDTGVELQDIFLDHPAFAAPQLTSPQAGEAIQPARAQGRMRYWCMLRAPKQRKI